MSAWRDLLIRLAGSEGIAEVSADIALLKGARLLNDGDRTNGQKLTAWIGELPFSYEPQFCDLAHSARNLDAGFEQLDAGLFQHRVDPLADLGAGEALGDLWFDEPLWYGQDGWQVGRAVEGLGGDGASRAEAAALGDDELRGEIDRQLQQGSADHRLRDKPSLKTRFFHAVLLLIARIRAAFGGRTQ